MATAATRKVRARPATSTRIGDRLPESAGTIRRAWHHHGLSIALTTLFTVTMIGQVWTGWFAYNQEQVHHGSSPINVVAYLGTGHFGEATFENGRVNSSRWRFTSC